MKKLYTIEHIMLFLYASELSDN